MEQQIAFWDESEEKYKNFIEKFKPKKTTDDCYTPPEIYTCIKDYFVEHYGLHGLKIVRPFFPGGDFETYDYPENSIVIDNPPFSIFAKICRVYQERKIKFILFAPHLTCFGIKVYGITRIITGTEIEYENGAKVKTSFVTNLTPAIFAKTAPMLRRLIENAKKEKIRKERKLVPKYEYPENVITASMLANIANGGETIEIKAKECVQISALDAQKAIGKSVYGGGILVSANAAERKAAAERADKKYMFELSQREKRIVDDLGVGETQCNT